MNARLWLHAWPLLLLTAALAADEPAPLSRAVTAALQPFVERHALAGAVALVADKDGTLSLDAVGYQDVEAKTPLKPDALFWIASQSKPITAAVVMMLVDEGKLKLDDPLSRYLPEFADQLVAAPKGAADQTPHKPAQPITIRHLLSHTSGLRFASPLEQPTLDRYPLSQRVSSYAKLLLDADPGTHYAYSNAGINTAARVLEVVSGQKYEDFLQQRLLDPLGMHDTTWWPTEAQVARLAKGYGTNKAKDAFVFTRIGQLHYPLTDRAERFPMPAGGLFSTAADCSLFMRMLLRGGELNGRRYLSTEAVAEMTRKQTPPALRDSYGLALGVGSDTFGHGGALATNMSAERKRGLVLVWLVQAAGFPFDGDKAQGAFVNAVHQVKR